MDKYDKPIILRVFLFVLIVLFINFGIVFWRVSSYNEEFENFVEKVRKEKPILICNRKGDTEIVKNYEVIETTEGFVFVKKGEKIYSIKKCRIVKQKRE